MKKTFVLDTCVFLSDPNCLKHFEDNDIIIPLKVLDEIDKNKARQDGAGFNARYVIRILDIYRTKGSLFKGVSLGENKGKLFVKHYDTEGLPHDFDLSVPDNQIIATALAEKSKYKRKKVIVVSQDMTLFSLRAAPSAGVSGRAWRVDAAATSPRTRTPHARTDLR